uniref:ribosomal protein S8 n=1 Tax=Hydrocytium acuminatum TaxID=1745963 RepID=UPI002A814BB3|nr:ribosomal protein S8 [Hydrocytium acuminatum]WOR09565.1 ribosomal protein S8 [Hydrocytium acuminatum]
MFNDPISDMLTRIRNACLARKRIVSIPSTKMNLKIAQILEKEGFIDGFETTLLYQNQAADLKITQKNDFFFEIYLKYFQKYQNQFYQFNLIKNKKIRKYFKNLVKFLRQKQGREKTSCITNLRRISQPGLRIYANHKELPVVLSGAGIVIVSTSKGIMTEREARFRGIGGEILCSVW